MQSDFDRIVADYMDAGMDRVRAVDVALEKLGVAHPHRSGPINRGIDTCYDCSALPGQRHTDRCDLSPARVEWSSQPFAFAPWLGTPGAAS